MVQMQTQQGGKLESVTCGEGMPNSIGNCSGCGLARAMNFQRQFKKRNFLCLHHVHFSRAQAHKAKQARH
jgi:hypothetical protein